MTKELKSEILGVLARHPLCVLATVSAQGKPEAAIVGLTANDKLELLFGTSQKTRKYANLQGKPQVAITVGDFEAEVQYEGTATQVDHQQAEEQFGTTPGIEKYRSDPTQTWWAVTPTWLRLTVHETPNRIEEVTFA